MILKKKENGYILNKTTDHRFYILVGDPENWEIALKNRIWGFKEATKGLWNKSQIGEYVAFYVTTPIKKIIGFGKIIDKYIEDTIIWSDEKLFNRSLWNYRFELEIIYLIDDWNKGIRLTSIHLNVGRKVVSEYFFKTLVKKADQKWSSNIYQQLSE